MSAPAPKVKQAPDVAFAMEQAEKARSRRAKAPNTPAASLSGAVEQDDLMAEAARAYREKGLPVPHMMFLDRAKQLKPYAYKGYKPILDGIDSGETFEIDGDIMVGCSEEQFQATLMANESKSARVIRSETKKAIESSGVAADTSITTSKGLPDGTVDPSTTVDMLADTEK